MISIPIINESPFDLPNYATPQSAGLDLRAHLEAPIKLASMERQLVGTGIKIALPQGLEAQVRPRSGLAAKFGITVLNSLGTIDADYRGEIGVILVNLSKNEYELKPGERIAQLVIAAYSQVAWELTEELDSTFRGNSGFGSTGNQ